MSLRARFTLLLLLLLTGACNLSTDRPQATTPSPATGTAGAGKPQVTISAPAEGSEVVVGTDLLIQARASDTQGVTRVQLIANDRVVRTESLDGERSAEVTLRYRPVVTGALELEVVAWRGSVSGEAAGVAVNVRANRSEVFPPAPLLQPDVPVIDPNDPTCRVLTIEALNVRVNAGTEFSRIRTLPVGSQIPVIGRLADRSWWQLSLRDGTAGWVAGYEPGNPAEPFVQIYGDCTLIPALAPPQATAPADAVTPAPAVTTATEAPAEPEPAGDRQADLTVSSLLGPDSLELAGDDSPVTGVYELTISNIGEASVGRFSVMLAGVPETGTIDQIVPGLGAGESISFSHSLTFRAPEVVIIVVTADSDGEIEERNEENNSARLDVTIS